MFREILNDKIGNLTAYLAEKIPFLSLTKLLKILYIIDEESVKQIGSPITFLDYKVWADGPVAESIYNEIKKDIKTTIGDKELALTPFIKVKRTYNEERGQEEISISAAKDSDLSKFSKFEKRIIDSIISEFGSKTAREIVDFLHEKGSLWDKTVKSHNLETSFAIMGKQSNVSIDFMELISDDPLLFIASKAAHDSLRFHQNFNC